MPGRGHSKKWWRKYEALRRKGYSKSSSARITNAGGKSKKKRTRRKKRK